ncbi:sialate O-acetylesterase [Paenibacillus koleovorans]|uniref:sialate O-acetylesterase n=1 Tax=Paenibacillus koleovorans TaxID=121608 RepID=UPI0013E2A848|nr:sialate O-acetylesterase [Paenibacillus koleovorans]
MDEKERLSGPVILEGPPGWSIIQQLEGRATIEVSGVCPLPDGGTGKYDIQVRLVGEADAAVIVPWTSCEIQGRQEWRISIADIPVGGLYRLESCLRIYKDEGGHLPEKSVRGDMIRHIGVGDLWVIAGQSNAAGYGQGPFFDPPELGVHLFGTDRRWDLAVHPLNGEGFNTAHSPMLLFAKTIYRETRIPVGLVQAARAGSPLKHWNPDEEGSLYRSMLDRIQAVGGRIRGVVWDQGNSDCYADAAETYLKRFESVVEYWRRDLADPNLPVLTVQMNRSMGAAYPNSDMFYGMVREAQRQAPLRISGVYVIPATDCALTDAVHHSPAGNALIGERLAKTALAAVYVKTRPYHAPSLVEARYQSEGAVHTVKLEFDHVSGRLLANSLRGKLFTIEDFAGSVEVSEWRITGRDRIEITVDRPLAEQAYIHGAYEMNPSASIPVDSDTYLPVLSFYRHPIQSIHSRKE